MSDVIRLIADLFVQIFQKIDSFIVVGSLSLLDFMIIIGALDIVIAALFVTFNVRIGSDGHDVNIDSGSHK